VNEPPPDASELALPYIGLAVPGSAARFAAHVRIATSSLPPAWAVFALRWLERNHHL